MQTHFSESQRADQAIQDAEAVLRKCVHCGFCTATCPTYRITGDERESPRGRISLIQNLLESSQQPGATTVANLDHCLSCLSCETACPSGVSYRLLIDQGRELIENKFRRTLLDRSYRSLLAWLLPKKTWFRLALILGLWTKPLLSLLASRITSLAALISFIPDKLTPVNKMVSPGIYPAQGTELSRVALITGCVQSVLAPEIDAAAIRVLTRHGCTIVVPETSSSQCCGALPHHLGKASLAHDMAQTNLTAWQDLLSNPDHPLDAVIITASGCGSILKDYPRVTNNDKNSHALALLTKDISVVLKDIFDINPPQLSSAMNLSRVVAWQNPCSLQHGLQETAAPISVLQTCGFTVREPRDAHLCCGSAGTYNLLQPAFAKQLGTEKTARLKETAAEFVVSANIGCITQLNSNCSADNKLSIIHLVEVVDWATGGPPPKSLT